MSEQPGPRSEPQLHDLTTSDLATTAALHGTALPEGFFASLGPRFLRSYHRTFVDSPYAVALGVSTDGRLDGFLLAVLAPAPHGAHVLRRSGVELGVRGALALFRRPRVLARFLRTRALRYVRALWRRACGRAAQPRPGRPGVWTVLSHVAVDDGARHGGRGALLVRELHDRAAAAGAAGVVLVTDPDGPGPGFYRRLDYDEEGITTGPDGERWLHFRSRLP